MSKKLSDYDIWYKKCECGYDPGRKTEKEIKNMSIVTCWKCGKRISRDFSERALKKIA
ncbi:MAG: hypothetical protein GY870_09495 [archaeon]|nr:hypothetical protein [archaeon]